MLAAERRSKMKISSVRMLRRIAVATVVSVGVSTAALAGPYDISNSPYTDISNYLYSPPGGAQGGNHATVTQTGNNNTTSVDTTAWNGGSYSNNVTTQTQIGDGNKSTMVAIGNSNALNAVQSGGDPNTPGYNNVSRILAVGNQNTLTSAQYGNNNTANIAAFGSGNAYSTTQTGNGLSYNLLQSGNNQSVSVTQTGTATTVRR
jgi:hypothetical protein